MKGIRDLFGLYKRGKYSNGRRKSTKASLLKKVRNKMQLVSRRKNRTRKRIKRIKGKRQS